jgi:hypothetical protein
MNRVLSLKLLLLAASALLLSSCGDSKNSSQPSNKFTNASLQGSFVFSVSGTDQIDGDFSAAGSFHADGTGKITSGIEDVNFASGVDPGVAITGVYRIDADGHGTITLNDPSGPIDSLEIQLASNGSAKVLNFDSTGAGGTLEKQDTASFSPAGSYSFTLSGEEEDTITASGSFSSDAGGNINGGNGSFNQGSSSSNLTLSGMMGPAFENGRGQLLLGGNKFSYYVVSGNRLILTGLEDSILLHGDAKKEPRL